MLGYIAERFPITRVRRPSRFGRPLPAFEPAISDTAWTKPRYMPDRPKRDFEDISMSLICIFLVRRWEISRLQTGSVAKGDETIRSFYPAALWFQQMGTQQHVRVTVTREDVYTPFDLSLPRVVSLVRGAGSASCWAAMMAQLLGVR